GLASVGDGDLEGEVGERRVGRVAAGAGDAIGAGARRRARVALVVGPRQTLLVPGDRPAAHERRLARFGPGGDRAGLGERHRGAGLLVLRLLPLGDDHRLVGGGELGPGPRRRDLGRRLGQRGRLLHRRRRRRGRGKRNGLGGGAGVRPDAGGQREGGDGGSPHPTGAGAPGGRGG